MIDKKKMREIKSKGENQRVAVHPLTKLLFNVIYFQLLQGNKRTATHIYVFKYLLLQ